MSDVFGTSDRISKSRRRISKALKEERAADIAVSAAQLLLGSDRQIQLLAQAARAFRNVANEAQKRKPETYEARRKAANAAWIREKAKRAIQTTLKDDRLVTEALARAIRRRKGRK